MQAEMVNDTDCHLTIQRKPLTLLHSEWPKLHGVLAFLSAIGLRESMKGQTDLNL